MENKSITELTGLICEQSDMIIRKNKLLNHASDKFHDLDKLATMCKGIRFTSVESASEFMSVMANTLRKLSYERFDLLEESNIEQPEAVQATDKTPEQELAEIEAITREEQKEEPYAE